MRGTQNKLIYLHSQDNFENLDNEFEEFFAEMQLKHPQFPRKKIPLKLRGREVQQNFISPAKTIKELIFILPF